jgi:hypothetical protein
MGPLAHPLVLVAAFVGAIRYIPHIAHREMGDPLLLCETNHLAAGFVQNITGLAFKPCASLCPALQQAPRAPTPRSASRQSLVIGGMTFVAQTLD